LHAMTVPPVRVGREAKLVPEKGDAIAVAVGGELAERDGCVEMPASAASMRLRGVSKASRGRVELTTCEPRPERTPAAVETNVMEIR